MALRTRRRHVRRTKGLEYQSSSSFLRSSLLSALLDGLQDCLEEEGAGVVDAAAGAVAGSGQDSAAMAGEAPGAAGPAADLPGEAVEGSAVEAGSGGLVAEAPVVEARAEAGSRRAI